MGSIWELLGMVVGLGAAFWVLAWLGSGSKRRIGSDHQARDENGKIIDDMHEMGTMGGLGGGGLDDLFVGRFGLRRMKMGERDRKRRK